MLKEKLSQFWKSGKFATSWIVSSSNLENSLKHIKNFANDIMNVGNLPIDNNPDFFTVRQGDTKHITVDLIRDLQDFLSTTPAVSDYKFAVIMDADLMNHNSSNCCLKILEEPPKNTFLFLLTSEPTNLSATIKSRCHKLYLNYDNSSQITESYNEFIETISKSNISQKISYLKGISLKAKEKQWKDFCKNSMHLILSLYKHNLDPQIKLSDEEYSYINAREFLRKDLDKRVEKVRNLIQDEQQFDLDKKHIGILILECLS